MGKIFRGRGYEVSWRHPEKVVPNFPIVRAPLIQPTFCKFTKSDELFACSADRRAAKFNLTLQAKNIFLP